MRMTKAHVIAIIFATIMIIVDLIFFLRDDIFFFLIGIAIIVLVLPFLVGIIVETNLEREKK